MSDAQIFIAIGRAALEMRGWEREAQKHSCDVDTSLIGPGGSRRNVCSVERDRAGAAEDFDWCESCIRWRNARHKRMMALRRVRYWADKALALDAASGRQ